MTEFIAITLPRIPVDTSTTTFAGPAGFVQLYFFDKVLNDIKAGWGDDYLKENYDQNTQAAFLSWEVTFAEFGGSLKTALDNTAQQIADRINDEENHGETLTIDSIAQAIKAVLPESAHIAEPIIDGVADDLKSIFGGGNPVLPGGSNSVGPWNSKFAYQQTPGSPIILDLTGGGVQTISENAGTYFDLRNTGFAEKTGWVAPQDGLLVFDPSAGPVTNGNQLFGNYTKMPNGTIAPNGFAALAALATAGATSLNATTSLTDPATGVKYFNELMVWQDANSNGVVDPGELYSLASLGIQALNLSYTNQGINVKDAAGNNPQYVGTYTTTGGKTLAMDDVNFANDTSQTVPSSWVATTPAIDALPDLLGMGTLYSLHQAMARDTTGSLQSLVTQFTTATTISARNALMEQILINWAGVQNVSPTSRNSNNGNMNAQHLEILEAAEGRAYGTGFSLPNPTDPYPQGVPQLNQAYSFLFERMYAELAAQTFLAPYYNLITSTTDSSGNLHFDFTAALASLFGTGMTHDNVVEFYRTVFASGLLDAQVNYAGLLSTLQAKAPQYVAEVNQIIAPYEGYNLMPSGGSPGLYDLNPCASG